MDHYITSRSLDIEIYRYSPFCFEFFLALTQSCTKKCFITPDDLAVRFIFGKNGYIKACGRISFVFIQVLLR